MTTNYEKIKAMSIDEMAEAFNRKYCEECAYKEMNFNDWRDCHTELHNFMKENDNVIKQLKSDLERLKDSFRMKYMYAIADTVYNRTKDLFRGIQYNRSVVMPYLDTIYGKSKCRKDIRPCFNSETLCKKLEKNDNLATQEGR